MRAPCGATSDGAAPRRTRPDLDDAMRPGRFSDWLDHCLTSYWFLPGLLTLGGGVCALLTLEIDRRVDLSGSWLAMWLGPTSVDGARSLLATLTGAMITLTGTVFSIVIVALTLASSQFGPRLLRGFLRDRQDQAVLGVLNGTFVYCLVGLVGIGRLESLPTATVALAMLLAVVDAFVLVWFIHHVAVSIHASNIVAGVVQEFHAQLAAHTPPEDDATEVALPVELGPDAFRLRAETAGYVRTIDEGWLLQLATAEDARIALLVEPGDFVLPGQTLARVSDEVETADGWNACFRLGQQRSTVQDVLYSIDQLVEVGLRALSPGINDPSTAESCVHRLGEVLGAIARTPRRPSILTDQHGTPRVMARSRPGFGTSLRAAFDPLLGASTGHPTVRRAVARILTTLAELFPDQQTQLEDYRREHDLPSSA
jgi:uncharacterized membrane protein